ncbi:MAG: glycosyltransferase family 2 protein [bacterium]|nr:glycosyltransferase family 2 protein [bacterium]
MSNFWYILSVEFALYAIVIIAIIRSNFTQRWTKMIKFYPMVTCIISCYSEGDDILDTIRTLSNQDYDGIIEILIMIDYAEGNPATVRAAKVAKKLYNTHRRIIKVVPKMIRGGLVSSRNLGLNLARGEIVIAIDGDCSVEKKMVKSMVRNFADPNVIAASGVLKVRNATKNFITALQAVEYKMGIELFRIGLAEINMVNNVSGAFGAFRRKSLIKIGPWRNGTAEDLDLTIRLKSYMRKYPGLKIIHEKDAVVYTDVPDTPKAFLKQRLRWDGDMILVLFRRYWRHINPKFMGIEVFFGVIMYNILFCVFLPIFITVYLFTVPSIETLIIIYSYYLFLGMLLYSIYICFVSNDKTKDLLYMLLMPIVPIFMTFCKVWTTIAIFIELCLKTHKDSNMAPWYVLRKCHENK